MLTPEEPDTLSAMSTTDIPESAASQVVSEQDQLQQLQAEEEEFKNLCENLGSELASEVKERWDRAKTAIYSLPDGKGHSSSIHAFRAESHLDGTRGVAYWETVWTAQRIMDSEYPLGYDLDAKEVPDHPDIQRHLRSLRVKAAFYREIGADRWPRRTSTKSAAPDQSTAKTEQNILTSPLRPDQAELPQSRATSTTSERAESPCAEASHPDEAHSLDHNTTRSSSSRPPSPFAPRIPNGNAASSAMKLSARLSRRNSQTRPTEPSKQSGQNSTQNTLVSGMRGNRYYFGSSGDQSPNDFSKRSASPRSWGQRWKLGFGS
jgi:hypothetical protein